MSKESDSLFYQSIGSSIQANKDKIEKLEKQVERLKKKNKELTKYKERNEKAVEYIKNHRKVFSLGVNEEIDEFDYISTSPKALLEILEDREDKEKKNDK